MQSITYTSGYKCLPKCFPSVPSRIFCLELQLSCLNGPTVPRNGFVHKLTFPALVPLVVLFRLQVVRDRVDVISDRTMAGRARERIRTMAKEAAIFDSDRFVEASFQSSTEKAAPLGYVADDANIKRTGRKSPRNPVKEYFLIFVPCGVFFHVD